MNQGLNVRFLKDFLSKGEWQIFGVLAIFRWQSGHTELVCSSRNGMDVLVQWILPIIAYKGCIGLRGYNVSLAPAGYSARDL